MADLALRIGISQQQLQKYEAGRSRVSASMIVEIVEALGISIENLFSGTGRVRLKKLSSLDAAREECHIWIDQAQSCETLRRMVRILRAMSREE